MKFCKHRKLKYNGRQDIGDGKHMALYTCKDCNTTISKQTVVKGTKNIMADIKIPSLPCGIWNIRQHILNEIHTMDGSTDKMIFLVDEKTGEPIKNKYFDKQFKKMEWEPYD